MTTTRPPTDGTDGTSLPRSVGWCHGRACALLGVAVAGLLLAGCSTRRTLTIDSTPSGATVWVNGRERGRTPVEVPFVHPGTWTVRLELPGYASVSQEVAVASTFHDFPVVDLPGELVVRDRRWRVVLPLRPLPARPSPDDLAGALERAHAYRERARREAAEPGTPARSPR